MASMQLPHADPESRALDAFVRSVRDAYGDRVKRVLLFGSRARGEGRDDSDYDVAVVIEEILDRTSERNRLSDLAYDVIVETSLEIQPWPISAAEWSDPTRHSNPSLVGAIHRDGAELSLDVDRKTHEEGAGLGQGVPYVAEWRFDR